MDMLAKFVKRSIATDEKNEYSKKPNGKKIWTFHEPCSKFESSVVIF